MRDFLWQKTFTLLNVWRMVGPRSPQVCSPTRPYLSSALKESTLIPTLSYPRNKCKFHSPKTKVELVREQSMELGQVHVWGYMGCHLQEGVIRPKVSTSPSITCTGPLKEEAWIPPSSSCEELLAFNLATVASSSWSNFLADPVSWPSPSTQATYIDTHIVLGLFFPLNAFWQNLKPVIVGKVSREMSHTGTNIKNALNPLVSFNAVNKPVQVQVIGCVDTHLSNLASLHISCCFLGFTCFLKTWRRPRS